MKLRRVTITYKGYCFSEDGCVEKSIRCLSCKYFILEKEERKIEEVEAE